jgi:uncharacterized protein YbbC (DUF1343 family)
MANVRSGLEVVLDDPALIGGRPWALLANHAAVTTDLMPARVALGGSLAGPMVRLFAPEHGLEGVAQDMESVADEVDVVTGAPVRSLYGAEASTLEPTAADLEGVGIVLVDLPDVGTRYYTFAATMDALMAACARSGVAVAVLDRPNPIGGVARAGGPVEPGCESFVSALPTPIRHGLTLGELAMLLHRERHPELELTVILCEGWSRGMWWDGTGLPWVPPSPNMPSLDTAAVYPGTCLVEATTISEGRGTTRPFHLVGAPWLDPDRLVAALAGRELRGCGFRSARFRPMFGKHRGEVCAGVEIHVTDRRQLEPVELGMHLLQTIRSLHPDRFEWRAEPYEFVSTVPAIDLLTGSAASRALIESGDPPDDLFAGWRRYVAEFEATLEGILLYHEP